MNKLKLLFLFLNYSLIFSLSIFSTSFGMGDDKQSGKKRPRQESSMSASEQDEQDDTESKRKKIDSVDPDGQKMELDSNGRSDESSEDSEDDELEDNDFWDKLFEENFAEINEIVSKSRTEMDFDFEDSNFYDAFKAFRAPETHEKCISILRLFLNDNLDWLYLFNIFLLDENKQALLLLKEKVIDKINNFSDSDLFSETEISFLPGDFFSDTYGYFRPLSPLFIAIFSENLDMVELIVQDFAADVNAAQIWPVNSTGFTPLQVAILFKNRNIIDYLISSGADFNVDTIEKLISGQYLTIGFVDNFGRNLLHIACENENIDLVKYLVSIGVDLDAKNNEGVTPICLALNSNFKEFFSYAFDSKIFDLKDNGEHFLSAAISADLTDTAKYFIDKGVGLDSVDVSGDTVLHLACKNKNYLIAYYLVKKGAKPDVANKDGLTPLDIIISDKCYCLELIYKLVMNSKRDANNKVLIPGSLKNSKDNIYLMFFNIIALFPSVCFDGNKPADTLCHLIALLNQFSIYIEFFLNFVPVILDDLVEDCKKNSVNLCLSEDEKNNINKVFYILWDKNAVERLRNKNKLKIQLNVFLKKIIDLLIQNGFDVNKLDHKNRSALHFSCSGIDEVVADEITGSILCDSLTRYLIEKHGAKVDARDFNGSTALFYAVIHGKKLSIIALLDNGASVENLDNNGTGFYELLQKSDNAKNNGLDIYFNRIRAAKEKFEKIKKGALEKRIFPKARCPICFEDFDVNLKRIFLMKCGHCLCEKCLNKSFIDNDGKFKACHECRAKPIDIEFDSEKFRSSVKVVEEMDAKSPKLSCNIL